jgi:hypothetical protein
MTAVVANDDEQYFSQDEEDFPEFKIKDKLIDTINDNTSIAKLTARELIFYTKAWCFNRELNEERVDELYNDYKKQSIIKPVWSFQIIEDTSNDTKGLYLIDGQHRLSALKKVLKEDDDDMKNEDKFLCTVYKIDGCEGKNKKISIDLFKKINNNRQFKEEELPDDFVADLVDTISNDPILKRGIQNSLKTETAHEPRIHKKELNILFNQHKDRIKNMTIEEIILNIKKINNLLSLKDEKLFGNKSKKRDDVLTKAKTYKFYLNLKSTRMGTAHWIKFIDNPNDV